MSTSPANLDNLDQSTDFIICPFTVIVDSREQAPYSFRGIRADSNQHRRPLIVPTEIAGLKTGDYSIKGLEDSICIERKSLEDAYGTFGSGRDRFERELERMSKMEFAAVVIEAGWSGILSKACGQCGGSGMFRFDAFFNEELEEDRCALCGGSGRVHPVDRSRLSPKSVHRSIISWNMRFPTVHFWTLDTRTQAEITTFRILEKFWKNREWAGNHKAEQ